MEKILVFAVMMLSIAIIMISGASGIYHEKPDHPYSRYSHMQTWCMYYTGTDMCFVPQEYCNEDNTERAIRPPLGNCPAPLAGMENTVPQLEIEEHNIIVTETEIVRILAVCRDFDGDEPEIRYSGWMKSSTKTTDYDDAGNYSVEVSCYDDSGQGENKTVNVEVLNNNRAPIFLEWGRE